MLEKNTASRIVLIFCTMIAVTCLLITRLLTLATQSDYVSAAASQSTYKVSVGISRGRIYDCKMRSLAGGRLQYRAVIEPSTETIQHLSAVLSSEEIQKISSQLTGVSPFLYDAENALLEGDGVRVFKCENRYGSNSIAEHLIGYLNGGGEGISGIEYAYDEYLTECSGGITAYYTVNSAGRSLSGNDPVIIDTTDRSSGGVVLTIDMDIQQIAESAADKFIEKGAIVIMETQTGKIRASVSRPSYDQNNVAASLECDDGQLVNRVLSAYDIGSVFKLVVAAAALEDSLDADTSFECEGSIQIGDNIFHCSNRSGHGEIDMCSAVASSCNIYFIKLAQQLGGEKISALAEKCGFGSSIVLADNYSTAAGCLPSAESLQNPAALANFSFGQGELMATPVHLAQLVATIVNGGLQTSSTVYECMLTSSGERFSTQTQSSQRVMSSSTAEILRAFMRQTVLSGTGKAGASEYVTSAAKTGTAQTGITQNGRKVLQAWYVGFFPYEQPEYVVTVLVEDGDSGGADAGPVFKYIAESMS